MLLHDFWEGCNGFATSQGSHFIPRGEAPRDEITPKGCSKTIASQPKVVQQYFCMDLLNKALQKLKLQSFFSHGTKTFAKNLCTIPWDQNLCRFFFVKLTSFHSFYFLFYVKLTEKPQFCCFMQNSINLTENFNLCKAFFPMGCCKGFLQQ